MPRWGFRHDPEGAFWSKVDKSGGPDACWPWKGAERGKGYGMVKVAGKPRHAHRVALEYKLGRPIAEGLMACHTRNCTTRLCCNPAHLYEGTAKQNAADTTAMGRHNTEAQRRGGAAGKAARQGQNAILSEEDVLEIYQLAWTTALPHRVIGERFGVTGETVSDIKRGKSWSWLTGHKK